MDDLDAEIVRCLEEDNAKWQRIERENAIMRKMFKTDPYKAKKIFFKALDGGLSPVEYKQIFGG